MCPGAGIGLGGGELAVQFDVVAGVGTGWTMDAPAGMTVDASAAADGAELGGVGDIVPQAATARARPSSTVAVTRRDMRRLVDGGLACMSATGTRRYGA